MKPGAFTGSQRSLFTLTVTLLVALSVGAAFAACGGSTEPSTVSTTASGPAPTEDPGGLAYEVVQFETEDGLVLSGRLYGSSTRAVLLSHMYPADQTSWDAEAMRLVSEGYMALTYDFRGYGLSQGDKDIARLDRDVTAAITYLQEAGAQEIVLVGASMGGTASLVAAAETQALSSVRVSGVATFSAPVEFQGLSAQEAVPAIEIAMLFVAAEDDAGAEGARQLESLSDGRGDLQILPGADHGTDLFSGDQADASRQLLIDFVRLCMPVGG